MPVRVRMTRASISLLALFTFCHFQVKGVVTGKGFEPPEFRLKVAEPAVAQLRRDQLRQTRIAQRQPAAGGDAVGHVVEFFGKQLVEVMEHRLLQKLRVQSRNSVDRVAADTGQVRHADVFPAPLVD